MANHLDFLAALDDYVRASPLGVVQQGGDLHTIARDAGLVESGDEAAARWTGQLVGLGFVAHGPIGFGDPRPLPVRAWTPQDVYRVSDYTVTGAGHAEAETVRRRKRDSFTDAALGAALPALVRPWMTDTEKRAVSEPLAGLRAALDAERGPAAVGAAKDLVEASCKVITTRAGAEVGENPTLPTLFKAAHRCVAGEDGTAGDLGRSLVSTAQRLGELRNSAGAGHGHAAPPQLGVREARLAAAAASGLSAYLLSAWA
ncbi:MAG TPA: abortive infection family protein [Solirubrobacterales bacterium]